MGRSVRLLVAVFHAPSPNRLLDSEAPSANFVVETRNSVPLQFETKPTVTVLSRKPMPVVMAKKNAGSSMEKLSIHDEDEDDDDDAQSKARQPTPEERKRQALLDREAKQRKYEEARERLFGAPAQVQGHVSASTAGHASGVGSNHGPGHRHGQGHGSMSGPGSGSNTPRAAGSASPSRHSVSERGRGGRGRGGSRPSSSSGSKTRQLYEPHQGHLKQELAKTSREVVSRSHSNQARSDEEHIIRQPRGPDGSGRGGMGFAARRERIP